MSGRLRKYLIRWAITSTSVAVLMKHTVLGMVFLWPFAVAMGTKAQVGLPENYRVVAEGTPGGELRARAYVGYYWLARMELPLTKDAYSRSLERARRHGHAAGLNIYAIELGGSGDAHLKARLQAAEAGSLASAEWLGWYYSWSVDSGPDTYELGLKYLKTAYDAGRPDAERRYYNALRYRFPERRVN